MFSLPKTQTPSLTSSISSRFSPLGTLFSSSLGSSNTQLNPPQLTRTPTFNPSNQPSSLQNPSNNGPSMGLNGLLNNQNPSNNNPLGGLFNKNPSQNPSNNTNTNNNLMGGNGLFNKNNGQNPPNNSLAGGLFNKNNGQNPSTTNSLGSFFNKTPTQNPTTNPNPNTMNSFFNTTKPQNPSNTSSSNNNLMGLNGLFNKNTTQNPTTNPPNSFFNKTPNQTLSNTSQNPGNTLFKNTLGDPNSNSSSIFSVSSTSGSLSSNSLANPTNNTSPKPSLFGHLLINPSQNPPEIQKNRGCFCKNPNQHQCQHQTQTTRNMVPSIQNGLFNQPQAQNTNPQGPLFKPTPLFQPQIPSQNTQNQPQNGLFPSPLQGLNFTSQANPSGPLFNNNPMNGVSNVKILPTTWSSSVTSPEFSTNQPSQAFPQAQKSDLFPMFPLQISQETQQINFPAIHFEAQGHHQPSQDSLRISSIFPHNPFETRSSRSRAYLRQRYEEEVSDLQFRSSLRKRSQALSSHRLSRRSEAVKNDVFETSSFFVKEKEPQNFAPLLLYVTLANQERSFAIEVSPQETCKKVKEAALEQIYRDNCRYDPEDYFLLGNNQRLEDEKTFEELGVSSESQLVLEEKTVVRASKKLPRVNPEYGMNPTLEELGQMGEEELANVENFCVWNEEAMVKFEGKVDLRNLDLAKIVVLKNKLVELYPEREGIELPEVGKGLNRPATIEFYNWGLPEKYKRNQEKYVEKVNDWAESVNGKLESLDFEQKIVVIQVRNFNA